MAYLTMPATRSAGRRLGLTIAGCATLAAAAAAQQPATTAPVVDVALSSFKFTPGTIQLDHGRAYVFHLTNQSGGAHDFTAQAFFDAATIAPADRARIDKGKVELGGGDDVDIHLIAPPAGRYKVHCTHFMHSMFGMTGEIVVN
jgi:uncharacterized cupredoxin-like copper-binding protein